MSRFTRFAALTLSILMIQTSPGLRVYEVLAGAVASQAASVKMSVPSVGPVPAIGAGTAGADGLGALRGNAGMGLPSVLPGLRHSPEVAGVSVNGLEAAGRVPVLKVEALSGKAVSFSALPAVSRSGAMIEAAAVQGGFRDTAKAIRGELKDFKAAEVSGEAAYGFGTKLDALLTGESRVLRGEVSAGVHGRAFSGIDGFGGGYLSAPEGPGHFAKPAGGESIGAAVRAHNGGSQIPIPPQEAKPESGNDGSGGRRAPLPARLFAAVVAALPGVILGLPLYMGGMTIAASLVAAASLGMVTMPFFGERSPRLVRVIPGILVGALGLWTLGAAVLSGAGTGAIIMGALTALGGWGLIRFGKSPNKDYYDEGKILTAFFGALAAISGAALAMTTPAAVLGAWAVYAPFVAAGSTWLTWAIVGAKWLNYPLSAMLLMHLPGWVGEGIESSVRGLYESFRGVYRVLGSIKRDTIMRERLERWTDAKLELSFWNIFKVGAVWIPVWIGEAAMFALSAVAGAALGALQIPGMFLWGAVDHISEKSAANKFLAAYNRFVFYRAQGSKKTIYNKRAAGLIAKANSRDTLVSVLGGMGLRLLQLGWLVYSVVATPFLHVIGFFRAFGQTGGEYDPALHSPNSIRGRVEGDSPFEKPEVGKKPVKDLIPPGLFAMGLAALPLYFFGMSALGIPVVGHLFLAAGLAIAVQPVLPAGTPKFIRILPGFLLAGLGVASMGAVGWLTVAFEGAALGAILAMAQTNLFWIGGVAALSGLGFINGINKASEKSVKAKRDLIDEGDYVGVFMGALGVLTGLGLAMSGGVTGWLTGGLMAASYASSLLLLMHLPRWFWTGIGKVFAGGWYGFKNFHRVLNFWERDTSFYLSMKSQARYYLKGSLWSVVANATWLSLIWVPTGLVLLVELVLAAALGTATGVLRAPFNWAWGASYDADADGKLARFFAGLGRSLAENMEGSKTAVFDRWVGRLIPAMNVSVAPSGRPSLKAALAFLLARFVQIGWLLRVFVGSPYFLLKGILDGIKNASGAKDKTPGRLDKDDPDRTY